MTALSGVRSSCDMLARNSDLWRLATSSSRVLLLELAEQPRVVDGHGRLAGERLQQVARSPSANAPGTRPAHDERADDLVAPAAAGRRRCERQPRGRQHVEVRVARRGREVGRPGAARRVARRPADERLVEVDARARAARRRARRSCRGTCAAANSRRRRVELEDRAALRARELDGAGDDRRQHLVDVEARAHGLADLAERAQLVDRAGELALALLELAGTAATFWIAIAPCAANVVTSSIVALVERLDLRALQRDHARPRDRRRASGRRPSCGSRRARRPAATRTRGSRRRRRSGRCGARARRARPACPGSRRSGAVEERAVRRRSRRSRARPR